MFIMENTKYQKLNSFFKKKYINPTSIDLSKQYTSQEVYNRDKLEGQQQSFLNRAWNKISPYIVSKSLYNEAQRLPLYIDYDRMDEYPIIGAALDIMAEEVCTLSNENKVLNISSDNENIKKELDDLFYNNLNVQSNCHMWARDLIKNGDNFLFLKLDSDKGVVDCKQLPVAEIERTESDRFGMVYGRTNNNLEDGEYVFQWKGTNTIQFKSWQVAHFRLLGSSKRLPYGQSVLEKARRIWKNLILVEDAMRSLVLIRGVDRKAFYVDIGNINDGDVESYIDKIVSRYKREKHVDPETGQIDLKNQILSIDDDYVIPVRGQNSGTRISDVNGQNNFNIEPIEYDLKLLLSALLIPKSFLNFEEAVGEGKNLSMMDIRFARRIKRIQQAMLFEFNKIAIIHLHLKGYTEELGNFSLSMNNPSIQEEIMKIDLLQSKVDLYKELVSDAGNGIAAMSMTKAKQLVMDMSPEEIILDLEQQRLEVSAANELKLTPAIIPNSGIFDRVDNIYGDPSIDKNQLIKQANNEELGLEDSGDSLGGGGGSSLGDETSDLGELEEPNADTNEDGNEENLNAESLLKFNALKLIQEIEALK